MQIFKLTKLTKLTEQIFAESAESAKSSRSIFATYATSASANFVGKESNESTEMYRVKSRIPSCYLRLASVFTSTRIRLASLICLCMLTIGSGNAWADTYTITFATNSGDGTKAYTSTAASTCTTAATYVTGNLVTASNTYYSGGSGLKLGTSSGAGDIKFNLSTDGQVVPTKVSVYAKYYSSSKKKTVQVCTNLGSNTATTTTGSFAEYSYSYSGSTKLSYIEIKSSGYIWVEKVVVTYTAAAAAVATPTFSPVAGTYDEAQSVTISCATGGTTIYYTTDGSTPTSSSSVYSSAVSIASSCTLKAIAKKGSDYSSVGSAAYVIKKKVNWSVNGENWNTGHGSPTTRVVAGNKVTALPTAPTSAACDNSKEFVGWTDAPYSHASTAPSILFTDAAGAPNVDNDVTYYAVFADAADGSSSKTYELTIERGDVPSSYSGTWSAKTATETGGGSGTLSVSLSGTNVMQSTASGHTTHIQFKASSTGFYNTTDLGTINSITTNNSDIKYYINSSSNPSSSGSGGYFRVYNNTSGARYTASIVINFTKTVGGIIYSNYATTCCADPGLNYGTGSVTEAFGADAFTNALTNSHSVAVTYSSSDETVATVNGSGQVTILKAGSTTITASSIAQTVAAVSYCADEASYTLTVNKASISPTLTYTPNSVAVGENTSAPTVGGNTGSGGVTYAITSATPAGCATIDAGTGVVSGVAVGSVTVTATVAATTNYNGGSATANVTITAASNFPNGRTIFIQAGKSGSAWSDNACVVAWFHSYGGSETAQPTYWLFDVTAEGDDKGKKLFAAVVPSSGDLPYLDINRYASDCTTPWNKNGGVSYSDASGSNTIRSEGSGNDQVYWNLSGVTMELWSSIDSWTAKQADITDQGSGIWTGTISDYTPDATSKDFKIKTNYNGWIGNTGSNSNATLSGMVVGSTYDVTATLDIKDHSLEMSKTFVKGTVHFNMQSHGSAISDLTNVTAGSKISAPSEPSDAAYNFGGWYKDAECTDDWDFANDVVNETMTLYAKWTLKTYTINYNKGTYGTGSNTNDTKTHDVNLTLRGALFTRDHYTQTAWNTADNGSGTTYTLSGTYTANAGTTLYPVWTPVNYTVTWYAGGTESGNITTEGSPSTSVAYNSKVATLPTTPDGSACDKVFVGWTNTTSYTHGTSLLFTDAAGSPAITSATNFYAVFATENVATGYTYIGDDGLLEEGETYIFVSSKSTGSTYALKSSTLPANNAAGKKGDAVSVTVATGIKVTAENSDLEFTCTSHNATDEEDALQIGSTANTLRINGNGIGYGTARAYYDATGLWGWNNDVNKFYDVYYNSTSEKFEAMQSAATRVYAYKKGGTTYSDYTINCASCSNEVTVSYSAPGSGNTMTVAKGVTSISSGDAVKTCSAVSLTVTLTPAAHYTVTNFAATGVTGVTTTNVGNVYTVNIPADKTGTLTLTPTFTAETPLTITLDTHSKGTFTPIGTIYSGDSFTFPEVTPNDAECADFVGWVEGTSIAEEGTSTEPTTIAAGSSSGTLTTNKTYTAVYAEKDKTESDAYVKVTSSLSNWSGTYLIVHDGSSRALDGSLTTTLGSTGDYFSVSITDGAIAATSTLATKNWTIAKIGETSTYTIKSASGYYIGRATASNGLDYTTTAGDADANSITYSSGVSIAGSASTAKLQYWVSGANACFKYYTSSQNAVSLYKLGTAEVVTYTYTVNPACTAKYRVTVNSATGGSPNADPKYLPEGETVTLTANPAAGYTFTSWTITKTTGGDNVTSTLLTGDKPTTANTTFAMPAYDVTVTAMYAKIYVTSVVAKDGETVLNTTDSKLNVHTGANKTVTVVVTPADAFDHSWSAEVTSGGTYASITNVTAEGFRVNGLAQGDATVTMRASNDEAHGGTPKTVTFMVHVTDIMPEEIILKREGSDTPIETLIMYYDASESKGQYVKVNVGYSPSNPTNKAFTFESALSGKVGSHSHAPASGYEVLVANGVTTDPVNCTFTSAADGSVTKVLAVTVLPILTDQFVDYIHGNATQTVSARLSADRYDIITDINTPSLSDASDSDPTSEDCETAHYHLIGWLPQATAEALWAAGTPITEATEGLVRAGVQVEATGQTWCAIWAKEAE